MKKLLLSLSLLALISCAKQANEPQPFQSVVCTADGNRLHVPAEPIYFTNFNGYTEANHYQVYGPLTDKSELKVKSTVPGVEIKIGKIEDGRATVRCIYNGKEKVFLIN